MSGRVALYQRRHLPTGARVPARSITRLGRDRARTTIGPSGSRIAARLLHAMARSGERLGIVPLCIGVGQGIAALRTRLKGTQWTNETTSPCSAPASSRSPGGFTTT